LYFVRDSALVWHRRSPRFDWQVTDWIE
jgi:hypothetical protein